MKTFKPIFFLLPLLFILPLHFSAENTDDLSPEEIYHERMALYLKAETMTQIPWYYYAAVDSYERGLRRARKDLPEEEGLIAIYYTPEEWVGAQNPDLDDTNPTSIAMFGGIGLDGNGDGKADITDDEDVLYTFSQHMDKYGAKEEDIKIALWDYYQRDKAVELVTGHAKVYKEFNTLDLSDRSFPVPLRYNYSYRSTWGDGRGWGGRRIHEGTDIFADHGTPVKSTTYGIVELKGWNKYGGWRVGIRDINNVYHYYAHLSSFEKNMERGTIVEPGTVIGYVGSSGYGKPGTQGKFPPHLHYGMYRDNGLIEWSFDPYPRLRAWEKQDRKK
ncbi:MULTISPECIES: M23 family metallopeptidase [Bacillaceae]|uniref:M23 family metallopeptidase n=1 Tax=Evansella alkalicola TaxID=745819 RepID=A0ABS6JU78_9BACI|nr:MULTISPECIES: M23 family metallopeptidase [Bacillaceae]MBU9722143.1 M23 family metallopeptidase [Bacillus alkalicola]